MRRVTTQLLTLAAIAATAASLAACGTKASASNSGSSGAATAAGGSAGCPGGVVRFGVEPFEDAAKLLPVFLPLTKQLGDKLGCKVELSIPTSYNAEIEAMRAGKLDIGEFGPLGYVLAHQVAKADAIATYAGADGGPLTYTASIITPASTGLTDLSQCAGKSFAYSDPSSTSGHLFPAYALKSHGIDPDNGVQAKYAGSHTASYEAERNAKVTCGELNSEQIAAAKAAGEWKDGQLKTLWQSDPIPEDPFAVRGDLPAAFKTRLTGALLSLDFSQLSPDAQKLLLGTKLAAFDDAKYDGIRALVKTLNIDLTKVG